MTHAFKLSSMLSASLFALLLVGAACGATNKQDSSGAGGSADPGNTFGSGGQKPAATSSSGAGTTSSGSGNVSVSVGSGAGGGNGEICGDGLDNNQDGQVDEGCACTDGSTQPCYVGDPTQAGVGACAWGTQTCQPSGEVQGFSWGACEGSGAPSAETCNMIDDNCDGMVDETGCPTAAQCMMSSVEEDFTAVCRNWKGSKHDHVDDCYVVHQCAPGCVADVVNLDKSVKNANGELSGCSSSVSGNAQMGESIRVDCTYDNINGVPTNQIDFACTAPP